MSNNLFIDEGFEERKEKNSIIQFDNSPLVLYHYHDDDGDVQHKSIKYNKTGQWEEFIVHLSRWNVLKKYRLILILLLIVHYLLIGSGFGGDDQSSWYKYSPRIIIVGLCWMYVFYSLVSSTISESIVAMKGKGIQLEKTTFLGLKTHQLFIPLGNIKYVAISEGFHIDCVIYYLAIVLKHPYKEKMVIVPFEMFNPRLNLLRKVYPKLKRVLFDDSSNK